MPPKTGEPDLPLPSRLQSALDESRQASGAAGAAASVIIAGEKAWSGVSGMSDPTAGKAIFADTLFDIGSIGKNYLAALILQLSREGRLSLDDPIGRWLESHPNIEGKITVRQLLNHTSGIYDYVKHPRSPWQTPYRSTRVWTQDEILGELVDKPYFSPGRGWHYSTTNYLLLRKVAAAVSPASVCTEIQNRYLLPLELNHTVCIDPMGQMPANIRIADNWLSGGFVSLAAKPEPWAATSPVLIFATAADLARWIHAVFYEKQVLSPDLVEQMLAFHSPAPNDPPFSGYGLGIAYVDENLAKESFGVKGVRMWGHGGSTHGYRAIAMYLPEPETSISVLINADSDSALVAIFKAILEVVTDQPTQSVR
jgi:D-alanyl-D-alanine carboxypeptidase